MSNPGLAASARKKLLRRGRALLRAQASGSSSVASVDLGGLDEDAQRELGEIHAALERIERGCYGRCDRCFGSVERERLETFPSERYCDACGAAESARYPMETANTR